MTKSLSELFDDCGSTDSITRMVAFNSLAKLGYANIFMVGGRFMHLCLTDEGLKKRDEIEATGAKHGQATNEKGNR